MADHTDSPARVVTPATAHWHPPGLTIALTVSPIGPEVWDASGNDAGATAAVVVVDTAATATTTRHWTDKAQHRCGGGGVVVVVVVWTSPDISRKTCTMALRSSCQLPYTAPRRGGCCRLFLRSK
jgi:hypothetical protein